MFELIVNGGTSDETSPTEENSSVSRSIQPLTTCILLSVIIVLSGCSAVTDLAEGTERPTRSPTPTDVPYSTEYGFGQPDDSVSTPQPLQNKTPREDINVTKSEELLVTEVNDYRTDRGLSELISDPRLALIARNHSYDMAERGFFAHENPEGQIWRDRVQRSNYNCRIGAENIRLAGWNTENVTTESELAYQTLVSFMESPPHNKAMTFSDFTTVGIGIYVTGDEYVFVTILFCG